MRGFFFLPENLAYCFCKNKKKGAKNEYNIKLKKKTSSIPDGGISMKESALTAGEMEKSGTQSVFGAMTGMEKMPFH